MLPPAVGTFENPRSSRELISQPPGAPGADEPVGPTQLRQCGNARRLIPIAIHEYEKSGHHRPLPPPQDRRRIPAEHEHIKNLTPYPALTGEGGKPNYTTKHIQWTCARCGLVREVIPSLAKSEMCAKCRRRYPVGAFPDELIESWIIQRRQGASWGAIAKKEGDFHFKKAAIT